LKLKYDEPLSTFAFNYNLRRYSGVSIHVCTPGMVNTNLAQFMVGRCRLNPVKARFESAGFSNCT
jgi:hypothetical protein